MTSFGASSPRPLLVALRGAQMLWNVRVKARQRGQTNDSNWARSGPSGRRGPQAWSQNRHWRPFCGVGLPNSTS